MRFWFLMMATGLALAACERPASTTTTSPTRTEEIKEDTKELGRDLKDAAKDAATQVRPKLEEAKEKGRELIHEGAEKVADWTETRPKSKSQ